MPNKRFINVEATHVRHSRGTPTEFSEEILPVIPISGGHAVDGFTGAPPQPIVDEAGSEAGGSDTDELIAGVPGVCGRASPIRERREIPIAVVHKVRS